MFMLRRRGVTRYPTTKLIDIVGLGVPFDSTRGVYKQLPAVFLCCRNQASRPTLGSTASEQLLTGTLAPAGTPQAPPTGLATDGADYLIPDLIAFLGPDQSPQRERFLDNRLLIYDTPQRIAARHQLRDRISSDDFAQVSFRGLGGGGKSLNLLRFVAEQRAVGDCVMYVHNCDDLVLDGHGVVAAALVTALTSAFPTLVSTDNVLIDLIARLEQWAPIDVGVYDLEKLAISNDFFRPVRNFVRHHGKRFIVVFDQENRISRVQPPTPDSDWARQFIIDMKANLVVVSASDNNDDHEQRRWPTIIQLPSPMPSAFARALLQDAAGNASSFLAASPEWTLLEEEIGTNGDLAPLEVGIVCARLRESRKPPGPNPFESVKQECRFALSAYYSTVFLAHRSFYLTVPSHSMTSLVTATSRIVAGEWLDIGSGIPVTLDRRFCAWDLSSVNRLNIVFASPLVKRVMYDVCLREQVQCFSHISEVVPAFWDDFFEIRLFDRFFSEYRFMTRAIFEAKNGVLSMARLKKDMPNLYLSPQHAFKVMKEDALVRGHEGKTKVLVMPSRKRYSNITGLLMSASMNSGVHQIDVYFLKCTVNPDRKDTFEHFFNHDFRSWVDMFLGDAAMDGSEFRFSFLWITSIKAIMETSAGRDRRPMPTWQLQLRDPTGTIVTRKPVFRSMDSQERPLRATVDFSSNMSIHRPPEEAGYRQHELRECHLYVDPNTLTK